MDDGCAASWEIGGLLRGREVDDGCCAASWERGGRLGGRVVDMDKKVCPERNKSLRKTQGEAFSRYLPNQKSWPGGTCCNGPSYV